MSHYTEKEIARDQSFSGKAVCKRCHCVMIDCEPMDFGGCFYHPDLDKQGKPHWCKNVYGIFKTTDTEIEPFQMKRDRRIQKRLGIRY